MEKSFGLLVLIALVMIGFYVGIHVGEKKYLGEAKSVYTLPEGAIYHVLWYGDDRYHALLKEPDGKILFVSSAGAKFPYAPNTITLADKKMRAVINDPPG
jgi:hypothetical protein